MQKGEGAIDNDWHSLHGTQNMHVDTLYVLLVCVITFHGSDARRGRVKARTKSKVGKYMVSCTRNYYC